MNGKQAKKIRSIAALIYQSQPKNAPQKSVEQIYSELKKVHKNKTK